MRKTTSVTHVYVVDYMNKQNDLEVTDEVLLEAEDDIVSAAVFIYQMEHNFGDEAQFPVKVAWDGAESHFVVLPSHEDISYLDKIGDKYYGIVVCTVRAAEARL